MIRAHCTEFGVVCPKGAKKIAELEQVIVDDGDIGLPQAVKELVVVMVGHLRTIRCELELIERKIQLFFKQNEACQHLAEILGIGVLSTTELVAMVGNANQFQSGRHLVVYLNLVPRQWSSGEKTNLCGISKRGDAYFRKLLIHGARSLCVTKVLQSA